ncbi:MFS transporter [Paraburkholderia sediminicola]|uniref:MFS transporter n=1 Tax=Paraburkholderia sediminicola TaxID=458836 RepID=UPI0038B77F39
MSIVGKNINITQFIDSRPLTRFQVGVITCCASVNALDGIDSQSIGVAAPFIAKGLGLNLAHFGPIFSMALLGASIGAATFGPLADYIGRKVLLIVATLMIGAFTFLTAVADSVPELMVFRFLAGIGLGGATPCFISLTSEFAPARSRAMLVTLMWSAFPLGAMIGGLLNSAIIVRLGWHAIFYIGGVLPLVLAIVLALYLPESIKFILSRRNDPAAVRQIVERFGEPFVDADARFVLDEIHVPGIQLLRLFSEGRAWGTLLLWIPLFMGFGVLTVAVLWTPSLLHLNGISPAATAFVVAFSGLGAFVGQSIAGHMIERFGIVPVLAPSFLLGAVATAGLGYGASSIGLAAVFIGLVGLFVGLGTAGAIALSTTIYPTAIRSSGVGMGMAIARLGQVVGPLIAGTLLGYGWTADHIMLVIAVGAAISAVFVALLSVWMATQETGAHEAASTSSQGTPQATSK